VRMLKLIFGILLLNHFIACSWFYVGDFSNEHGQANWLNANEMIERNIGYQYTTSLHWTLTQFTPASMEVVPKNTGERVFSIVVLVFSLLVFSSLVGSITVSMTTVRNLSDEYSKSFWMLRKYLSQQQASKDLCRRIVKYLEQARQEQASKVQESGVTMLLLLPEPLRQELVYEMKTPLLKGHPIFLHMINFSTRTMRQVCRLALKSHSLASEDVMFGFGEKAERMYFVVSGILSYTKRTGHKLKPPVTEKDWVSEATLWTSWRHMGELRANQKSDLVSVDAARLFEIIGANYEAWSIASEYASLFVEGLNNMAQSAISDIIRDEQFYYELCSRVTSTSSTKSPQLQRKLTRAFGWVRPLKRRGGAVFD